MQKSKKLKVIPVRQELAEGEERQSWASLFLSPNTQIHKTAPQTGDCTSTHIYYVSGIRPLTYFLYADNLPSGAKKSLPVRAQISLLLLTSLDVPVYKTPTEESLTCCEIVNHHESAARLAAKAAGHGNPPEMNAAGERCREGGSYGHPQKSE